MEALRGQSGTAQTTDCVLSFRKVNRFILLLCRLYNKEAIIEKLLDESKFPNSAADHIRKLKDVRVLKLTNTPKELQSHELSSGLIENSAETFCCPVMGQEMNGSYPFVYSWECGCVVSKRAFDAVNDSNCLNVGFSYIISPLAHLNRIQLLLFLFQCGKPFFPNSIILLNPEDDDDIKNAEERLKAYKEGAKMVEHIIRNNPSILMCIFYASVFFNINQTPHYHK